MAQHPAEGGPLQKAARAFNTELQATVLQGQEITAAIWVGGGKIADIPVERRSTWSNLNVTRLKANNRNLGR
jgi:hypothetical protein